MKPKIKIIAALFVLVFVSAGCGGGGGAKQQEITLNYWDPFETSDNLEPLFADFTAKYPNIHVVYSKKDITTYSKDLLNALASGSGPDIFSINNSWLPQYLDKITPAPDNIWQFKEYKDAFVDAAVNDLTLNKKIYASPLAVDSLALYYNKDVLGSAGIATPPKTWAELVSDVKKIRRSDRTGYFTLSGVAAGTNANVNRAVDILDLLMLQKGTVPYTPEGTQPTFAQQVQINGNYSNPALDALTFYTSFANPSDANYNWNSRSDYSIDAFANGRAAFLYNYSYTTEILRKKNPNLNFDVAAVPQPNLDQPAVNFANYWGEAVSEQSKNKSAAWTLIKYLTTKEVLDKYYATNKQPASRKDLIALQIQDPDIGVFANANLTAKTFYKPDQAALDAIFGKMIDSVILSGVSPQEALSQAESQAQTLSQ